MSFDWFQRIENLGREHLPFDDHAPSLFAPTTVLPALCSTITISYGHVYKSTPPLIGSLAIHDFPSSDHGESLVSRQECRGRPKG